MRINTSADIGALLKDARKRKGWTQGELAKRMGLYQKDISLCESQPGKLNADRLLALCAILEIDLSANAKQESISPVAKPVLGF